MPELPTSFEEFSVTLDAMGEEAVRTSQASAKWGNNGMHKNWADEWLRRKTIQHAQDMHAELLAEIQRPHWSVTPTFWLLIAALVTSLLALAASVFGLPQVQKLIAGSSQTPSVGFESQTNQLVLSQCADPHNAAGQRGGSYQFAAPPNPSIERTCPGKPGHASHLKR